MMMMMMMMINAIHSVHYAYTKLSLAYHSLAQHSRVLLLASFPLRNFRQPYFVTKCLGQNCTLFGIKTKCNFASPNAPFCT